MPKAIRPRKPRDPAGPPPADETPFWRRLTLAEMSGEQWESLCDGCGRCCLNKLEDEATGEIFWTEVACRLLDEETCRCGDYPHRHARVSDCIALTPENVPGLAWLPPTCGYRLVAEQRDLYWWHPLVSGDPASVHHAGISVRGRTESELDIAVEKFEEHVVEWPGEDPADRIEVAERGRELPRRRRVR
jgi:hypothetical protein